MLNIHSRLKASCLKFMKEGIPPLRKVEEETLRQLLKVKRQSGEFRVVADPIEQVGANLLSLAICVAWITSESLLHPEETMDCKLQLGQVKFGSNLHFQSHGTNLMAPSARNGECRGAFGHWSGF